MIIIFKSIFLGFTLLLGVYDSNISDICSLLPDTQIQEILGWDGPISKSDDSFRRVQMCTLSHGEETLTIRKNVVREKAKKNNPDRLKNSFQKYLVEGENHLSYTSIQSGNNEIIFGEGAMDYGLHNYIMRYRHTNDYELILEFSGTGKDVIRLKEKLKALMDSIQN